jgi:hypothetical protein
VRFHITGRAGGKTFKALAWLAADVQNRVLITHAQGEATRLHNVFVHRYGHAFESPEAAMLAARRAILAVSDARSTLRGARDREVYVDNTDLILRSMFGNVVQASACGSVIDAIPRQRAALDHLREVYADTGAGRSEALGSDVLP